MAVPMDGNAIPFQSTRPRGARRGSGRGVAGWYCFNPRARVGRDLVESGMSDAWIMKHIGMDADELLRLKQISGLAALFKDKDFSAAWAKDEADARAYEVCHGND